MKDYIVRKGIKDTTIIQVGDFGVGFINEFQQRTNLGVLNKWLRERNIMIYVFRGNHDNPNYFNGDYFDGPHAFTNIKFCPDYTMITVEGKNIFGVGGGTSIDRVPRRKNNMIEARHGRDVRYHWEEENFNLDLEKIEGVTGIDIVVTHTAPDFVYPRNDGKNWPFIVRQFMGDDPTLGEDLMRERDEVTTLFNELRKNNNFNLHIYGHFHTHVDDVVDGVHFILLDINEMYEIEDFTKFEDEMNEKYGE
jgi:predicted phosphodiesterase